MAASSHYRTLDELDRETVAAVRSGDPHAFSSIVDRYTNQVYRLARASLRDPHDAEEAVQDIFLKAFRGLESFDTHRRLYPWLYSIAINHLRSIRRRLTRSPHHHAISLAEELLPDNPADPSSNPEAALLAGSARAIVEQAIMALSAAQRQAFTLRHIRGLSTAETADIMGLPENTVKTHLRRARERLQKALLARGLTGENVKPPRKRNV